MVTKVKSQSNLTFYMKYLTFNNAIIVFVFILMLSPLYMPQKNICDLAKEYRNEEFEAVVKKKYIDAPNHGEASIVFDKPEVNLFLNSRPDGDRKKVWDYVMIGDTIRKIKNTNTIKIKRRNTKDSVFYLYYDCVDTAFLSK